MMPPKMLLLTVLWAVLLPSSLGVPAHERLGENKVCCDWNQMEGKIFQKIAQYNDKAKTAVIIDTTTTYHYDYVLGKSASETKSQNGKVITDVLTVIDYKAKIAYTVMNDQCFKANVTQEPVRCLPDGAVLKGSHSYLDYIVADTWEFQLSSAVPINGTFTTTIPRDNYCAPLFATTTSVGKIDQLTTATYINVTSTVKDPSVFDVPAACKTAHLLEDPGRLPHPTGLPGFA